MARGKLAAVVALTCTLSPLLRATDLSQPELAHLSPFLPPGPTAAAGAKAGPDQALELRGIMNDAGDERYWIFDIQKKSGAWVGLREKGYPFAVVSADSAHNEVRVRNEFGRILTLSLRDAKVNDTVEKSGPGLISTNTVASENAGDSGDAPKPETDPRWKKLEDEAAQRALARAQAARNAVSP